MKHTLRVGLSLCMAAVAGCSSAGGGGDDERRRESSFQADAGYLQRRASAVLLAAPDSPARVLVSPALQGRVMTSATMSDRPGFGWINRQAIEAGQDNLQFNNYGGEDRFWLGPEAGQFGLFFSPGKKFAIENWFVPSAMGSGPFDVVSVSASRIDMRRQMGVSNHSGTKFLVEVHRAVRVLTRGQIRQALDAEIPDTVAAVGFVTENTVTNQAPVAMEEETGLLSIRIIGQFKASQDTIVVAPFVSGPETTLGPVVTDEYFGSIPADRLKIEAAHVLFRADGRYRSKFGLSPRRAGDVIGSFDHGRNVLTIVKFSRPAGATEYVNSLWKRQDEPFGGDVINSCNDGPLNRGAASPGGFYELETSSPVLRLAPGESGRHAHCTVHLEGPPEILSQISEAVLGLPLADARIP